MRFPIIIEPRRSFFYGCLLAFAHLAAIGAVWVPPWPRLFAMVATLAIVASLLSVFARSRPPKELRLVSEDRLEVGEGGDNRVAVSVLPDSVVFPWVIVLRYRVDGLPRAMSVVLFPDQMANDDFRRLSLWLRWYREARSGVSRVA